MTFDDYVADQLRPLLRFATVLTRDPYLAEDIVQEVLVRAHRKWRRIGSLDAPDAYVRRMITNQFLSWRRRKSTGDIPTAPHDMIGIGSELADPTAGYDVRAALMAEISRLPRAQQAVLVLRYFCDMSHEQIAKVMGSRVSTVRSTATRALARLRIATNVLPLTKEAAG